MINYVLYDQAVSEFIKWIEKENTIPASDLFAIRIVIVNNMSFSDEKLNKYIFSIVEDIEKTKKVPEEIKNKILASFL
jgi:hypothetical protein